PDSPRELCQRLSNLHKGGNLKKMEEYIFSLVGEALCESQFEPIGFDSDFGIDGIDSGVISSIHEIKFKLLESPNLIFKPVDSSNDFFVIASELTLEADINFYFSFFASDSEGDFSIGSSSRTIRSLLDVDVLIYFTDSFEEVKPKIGEDDFSLQIDYIEAEVKNRNIEVGYVAPDWIGMDDE
ncbi:hypothetical protein, partial [Spirulina sp. 06S082]|uniref:hypothetical protein n=1 Tax=Spirulina sp. 06S082 TaxID=3110248 RepID=UPI002B1FA1E2